MSTYKEMYLMLFNALEKTINTLIDAQRQCEEMYLSLPDPPSLVELRDFEDNP